MTYIYDASVTDALDKLTDSQIAWMRVVASDSSHGWPIGSVLYPGSDRQAVMEMGLVASGEGEIEELRKLLRYESGRKITLAITVLGDAVLELHRQRQMERDAKNSQVGKINLQCPHCGEDIDDATPICKFTVYRDMECGPYEAAGVTFSEWQLIAGCCRKPLPLEHDLVKLLVRQMQTVKG